MYNYTLLREEPLPDIKSTGFLYEHASGAKIIYIKNSDENKVFSAAFKTPPFDETGLPHIMEHCVLAGSEKYRCKEPFNELIKGSLYTFLNAMTWADKTCYPIASCNDKDFLNLMDVYMDAVFFPAIYDKEESFLQEAWHYDVENGTLQTTSKNVETGAGDFPENAENPLSENPSHPFLRVNRGCLKYNGIVYNEMKGAYSDPDYLIEILAQKALFPDACYRFDSGGNPDFIPGLAYEDFLNFHREYYAPENCCLYFYGNMDIEHCLKHADESYLSKFKKMGKRIEIEKQPPLTEYAFAEGAYSVTDESAGDKNYAAASFVVGDSMDSSLFFTMDLLEYLLLKTPAAPLKKALIERGMGEDVTGYYSEACVQPTFNIIVKNSKYTAKELKEAIFDILRHLVDNGIDKETVEACLNRYEFRHKEEDFGRQPKGLIYMTLTSWLYCKDGDSPFGKLHALSEIERLREKCGSGYLEQVINDYFLSNTHCAFVTLFPDGGLDAANEAALEAKLAQIKDGLTDGELDAITAARERLRIYQDTPDTAEALATVPLLSLSDVKKEAQHIPSEEKVRDGYKILHTSLDTNGIIYSDMYFGAENLDMELLQTLNIYLYLLGKLNTRAYSFERLDNEVNAGLGGLSFKFETHSRDDGTFKPFIRVSSKALAKDMRRLFALISEITGHTAFDNKDRIRALMSEMKAKIQSSFVTGGHIMAINRAVSYVSKSALYGQYVNGIDFYERLSEILDDFDAEFPRLAERLRRLPERLFCKGNLFVSAAADEGMYLEFERLADGFYDALPNVNVGRAAAFTLEPSAKNEGFITPSRVQYNAAAADFRRFGYEYGGCMKVLNRIISDGYLMEEIRLKGGAYGWGSHFSRNGSIYMYSYRDPKCGETYDVYNAAAAFVSSFDASGREMTKYILGTVNTLDKPLTNAQKCERAAEHYLSGVTRDKLQAERDGILAADSAQIRAFAPLLSECFAEKNICTFGGDSMINLDKKLFKNIKKL